MKIKRKMAGLETRISTMAKGEMGDGSKFYDIAEGRFGYVSTEYKAVLHGFKTESREADVKAFVIQVTKAFGMKEEHAVDFQEIQITHAFVEFQDTRTRDRFVRSASMRKYELDRRIKITQTLELDERFDRKRLVFENYVLHKD